MISTDRYSHEEPVRNGHGEARSGNSTGRAKKIGSYSVNAVQYVPRRRAYFVVLEGRA